MPRGHSRQGTQVEAMWNYVKLMLLGSIALLAAIGTDGDPRAEPYRSVWRLAGLLENAESASEPPRPGAPSGALRKSPGASLT